MNAHKIQTTVRKNGTLTLTGLPFEEGKAVEVIILERPPQAGPQDPYPLRGSVLSYDTPHEPAVPEEYWDALR